MRSGVGASIAASIAFTAASWSTVALGQAREVGSRDAVDARYLQSLVAIGQLDPTSPEAAPWRAFIEALARNVAIRQLIDAPFDGDATWRKARVNGLVVEVVALGLLRADDADLVAARPLIRKMLGRSGPVAIRRTRRLARLERSRSKTNSRI